MKAEIESLLSTEKKISTLRIPIGLHSYIKSLAALRGTSKDELVLKLILSGLEHEK
jgi:hypothetical protein